MSVVRCSSCDAANKGRDTCGGCGALLCVSISAAHLREVLATARRDAWIAGRDAAAEIADGFTCGGCGMDGKSGKAIRALTPPATENEQ